MKMKFNLGDDPLTLRGSIDDMHISVELEDPSCDGISMEAIEDVAEKIYSTFHVDLVSLYRDDVFICEIEKQEEED